MPMRVRCRPTLNETSLLCLGARMCAPCVMPHSLFFEKLPSFMCHKIAPQPLKLWILLPSTISPCDGIDAKMPAVPRVFVISLLIMLMFVYFEPADSDIPPPSNFRPLTVMFDESLKNTPPYRRLPMVKSSVAAPKPSYVLPSRNVSVPFTSYTPAGN